MGKVEVDVEEAAAMPVADAVPVGTVHQRVVAGAIDADAAGLRSSHLAIQKDRKEESFERSSA